MEIVTARKEVTGMTKVDMEEYFDDVEVESLYNWIDTIPLSRPKKNLAKDFADGVLCAEIIKHYFPKLVNVHNYAPAASTKQRLENWYLLNRRVFRKLELDLSEDVLRALAQAKPKVIERVLMLLRLQIDKLLEKTSLHVPDTPPGLKSAQDVITRPISPGRLMRYEPATSPRKYSKGEISHGHPDRATFVPPVGLNETIPRFIYEEKEIECQTMEETIQILNAKVQRLEHLNHLKDVRIQDLHSTLQQTLSLGYATSIH